MSITASVGKFRTSRKAEQYFTLSIPKEFRRKKSIEILIVCHAPVSPSGEERSVENSP